MCVGLNFRDHAEETGQTPPDDPVLFFKSTTAIVGPDDDLVLPRGSTKTDWEVELAVVIGATARYVSEGAALDHVAGYVLHNDYSEREYQLERGAQWDKGKGCDTFAPLGPFLATPDEVGADADRAGDVAHGQRRAPPAQQHRPDGLRRGRARQPDQRLHDPAARRRHLHRHAGRRRPVDGPARRT